MNISTEIETELVEEPAMEIETELDQLDQLDHVAIDQVDVAPLDNMVEPNEEEEEEGFQTINLLGGVDNNLTESITQLIEVAKKQKVTNTNECRFFTLF